MVRELTVLMAVHNGIPYLDTAIESILQQTYSDFDFLIVDDASSDETVEVINSYHDDRIQLICLENNVGQTAALNIGLRQTSTPWIARMDADDYAAPDRFEKQMSALRQDPSLGCVGTFAWTFREDPQSVDRLITPPTDSQGIKRASLSEIALIHGCIIASREAMVEVGAYNEKYRYSADTEFFDRLLAKRRAINLPTALMGLRLHGDNASFGEASLDENIEIITNRLMNHTHSDQEAAIVSANLSWAYLLRARRKIGGGHFQKLLPDVWRALLSSPKWFPWYSFKIFAIYNLTAGRRAMVKRAIIRVVPGLKARW